MILDRLGRQDLVSDDSSRNPPIGSSINTGRCEVSASIGVVAYWNRLFSLSPLSRQQSSAFFHLKILSFVGGFASTIGFEDLPGYEVDAIGFLIGSDSLLRQC